MTLQDVTAVSQHGLMTATDCQDLVRRVLALEEYWTPRSQSGFYSLGAASYLDARDNHALYLATARRTNGLLASRFADLYARLIGFFEDFLGEPVEIDATHAAPGFHVFVLQARSGGGDNAALRAHFDLQWMLAYPGMVPDATLSFTLLIAEPGAGASLAVWNLRYQDPQSHVRSSQDYAAAHPPQTVAYAPGMLVLHDGLILHAIGRLTAGARRGHRITLQGHGVRFGQRWLLYW